jgi:hypothetical protein
MNQSLVLQRSVLATAAVLCTLPAAAGSLTLPGSICESTHAADRPASGALLNTAPGSTSFSKFSCPVMHTRVPGFAGPVSVRIYAKLNLASNFDCALRSVLANGTIFDTATIPLPTKSTNNGGFWTTPSISVALPPFEHASVHFRCDVPNVAGESAGIISYRIED